MLMETKEAGLLKLEALADKLDKLPEGQYDQGSYASCALYHYFGSGSKAASYSFNVRYEGIPETEFGGLTPREMAELFCGAGCGNARYDAKKAAAYIRKFVRERRLAALPLHERILARLAA